jgi:hypothetical protein
MQVMLEGMAESQEAPTSRELFVAYIVFALKASNWSKTAAAKRIGIGRASMYRLVLNPDVQDFAAEKGWLSNLNRKESTECDSHSILSTLVHTAGGSIGSPTKGGL